MSSVSQLLMRHFPTVESLADFYKQANPTAKKVIGLLKAFPKNANEESSLKYFKQFIWGLNNDNLGKCLRFMSGSDILCVEGMDVAFNELKGLQRRLVAHTCGPCIELPSTYSCYSEMRQELQTLLQNDCFVNIVNIHILFQY